MLLIACLKCRRGLRVVESPTESEDLVAPLPELASHGFPCPTCDGECTAHPEDEVSEEVRTLLQIREITPIEAFMVCSGLGLPEERAVTEKEVIALFGRNLIRAVPYSSGGRVHLDYLEFDDGTRVYFGSGTNGALVYRIRKPTSFVEGV